VLRRSTRTALSGCAYQRVFVPVGGWHSCKADAQWEPSSAVPADLLTSQGSPGYSYGVAKGIANAAAKTDVLQGTLDLMVLKTLESMGPQHGYGIARRIEQISDAVLKLNEGTVYAALTRLQHQGWVSASWGISENNRKAKFYTITRIGRRQLTEETRTWERIAGVISRLLRTPAHL
jgi:PadR family transcriptional regulator, regulatory protein PadR